MSMLTLAAFEQRFDDLLRDYLPFLGSEQLERILIPSSKVSRNSDCSTFGANADEYSLP